MRYVITRQSITTAPPILNSWKEIATYLDRGVRTVQRWERDLHLPVHRIGNGRRSPVYANVAELKFWLNTSEAARKEYHGATPADNEGSKPGPVLVTKPAGKPIENARRLLTTARDLARQIAETSVRQRRQAEDLQNRILQMRTRVR